MVVLLKRAWERAPSFAARRYLSRRCCQQLRRSGNHAFRPTNAGGSPLFQAELCFLRGEAAAIHAREEKRGSLNLQQALFSARRTSRPRVRAPGERGSGGRGRGVG